MLLERAVEGGFRFISHLCARLSDADCGLNQSSRRELHAPPAEIVHWGNPDVMCEAIGEDRSRQSDFAGKAVERPILRRPAMDQLQRLSNMPVAQSRKPTAQILRQPSDIVADDFDKHHLGEPCQHGLAARAAKLALVRGDPKHIEQPALGGGGQARRNLSRQRVEERIERS